VVAATRQLDEIALHRYRLGYRTEQPSTLSMSAIVGRSFKKRWHRAHPDRDHELTPTHSPDFRAKPSGRASSSQIVELQSWRGHERRRMGAFAG